MALHPDKFSVLPITRRHNPSLSNYTLHGQTLERVTSTKYLRVTLESTLNFSLHINSICNKANKTLGFLRRNLKLCSSRTKELAYKAMVRPIAEYASCIWDPYTVKLKTNLEKIHSSSEGQHDLSQNVTGYCYTITANHLVCCFFVFCGP